MADQNFHYPTSSTYYTLPSGDDIRITLWYDDGTGASNTDMTGNLIKISPLEIPLDINQDETFRFAKCKFTFSNPDEEFEDGDIYKTAYKNKTFIKIISSTGGELWRGRVRWEKTTKNKWYSVSGGLSYREFTVYAIDILEYTNTMDMSDISYADGNTFYTIFLNIGTALGLSVDFDTYDKNFRITEAYISLTYALISGGDALFKAKGFAGTYNVLDFIKAFQRAFACSVWNESGDIKIMARNEATAWSIDSNAEIISAKKVRDPLKWKFVKIKASKDWDNDLGAGFNSGLGSNEDSAEHGTEDSDTSKNLEIDASTIFEQIHITHSDGNATFPSPAAAPDAAGDSYVTVNAGMDQTDDEIESGMPCYYNWNDPLYDGASLVTYLSNYQTAQLYDTGVTPTTVAFYIKRQWDANYRIFKIYKCVLKAAEIYEAYLFDGEPVKVKIVGVREESNYMYTFNSKTYIPYKIVKDYFKNWTEFSMREIT